MTTLGVLLPVALLGAQVSLLLWPDVRLRGLLAVLGLALAFPVTLLAVNLDPGPADCGDGWCSGAEFTGIMAALAAIPIVILSIVRAIGGRIRNRD